MRISLHVIKYIKCKFIIGNILTGQGKGERINRPGEGVLRAGYGSRFSKMVF